MTCGQQRHWLALKTMQMTSCCQVRGVAVGRDEKGSCGCCEGLDTRLHMIMANWQVTNCMLGTWRLALPGAYMPLCAPPPPCWRILTYKAHLTVILAC